METTTKKITRIFLYADEGGATMAVVINGKVRRLYDVDAREGFNVNYDFDENEWIAKGWVETYSQE